MRLIRTRYWSACLLVTAYCLLPLVTTGCVRRSLTIRTDPPGATVYLNDQIKGESPVTFDFMWYGWHRVILRKEGFERIEDRKLIRAPVYLWIPFDLGMELLPFQVKDKRTFAYTLTPAKSPPIPQPPPPQSPPTKPGTPPEESHEAR